MAESRNDDLADALAKLASGDVAPSEQMPAGSAPLPPPPPPPAAPAAKPARPVAVRPAAARPAAPAAPKPPAPRATAPVPPPVTPRSARPAAPVLSSSPRPPAPTTAPPLAPAAVRKQRPSAPTIRQVTVAPNDAEVDGGQSTGLSNQAEIPQVVDDDDAVIVPAPEASVFIPKKKPTTSADARAAIQRKKNLEFRRTLIPILLTSSMLMLIFGVLKFVAGPDSTLQAIPNWIPIALLCGGVVLLAFAGANMMSVKQQLDAEKSQS